MARDTRVADVTPGLTTRTRSPRYQLDQLLRLDEAAAALAVSTRTLRNFVYRGEIEPVRLGRAVRFRSSDVARLQQRGTD